MLPTFQWTLGQAVWDRFRYNEAVTMCHSADTDKVVVRTELEILLFWDMNY
jgi:hypothetical protein